MKLRTIRKALEGVLLMTAILLSLFVVYWGLVFLLTVVAYFSVQYILYRHRRNTGYNALAPWKKQISRKTIRSVEENLRKGYTSLEERLEIKGPLGRYFYLLRWEMLKKRLATDWVKGEKVLDLGCGYGNLAINIAKDVTTAIGCDISSTKIKLAHKSAVGLKQEGCSFIVSTAEEIPLRSASVKYIVCTEVLEHLIDPRVALKEMARVLSNDGILLLTTPSAHRIEYEINPLIILEKVLSLRFPRILPPHHGLHEYDNGSTLTIHEEFTIQQIKILISKAGLKVRRISTFRINLPVHILYAQALLREGIVGFFERFMQEIPVLRMLGQTLWIEAEKL